MKRLVVKFRNKTEDGVVIDAKIRNVKNVARRVVYIKHTSAGVYMIRLTFVYILYSLYIVCMYKKHINVVSVT